MLPQPLPRHRTETLLIEAKEGRYCLLLGEGILKGSKTVFLCPPEADCGNTLLCSIAANVFFKLTHYLFFGSGSG
jgi:hypothetical protein